MLRRLVILSLALVSLACGKSYFEGPTGPVDPATQSFAPSLNVEISSMNRTASGLYYRDRNVGQGQIAASGDSVRAHYTGWLPDGLRFDTSRGADPLYFKLGVGSVIRGFDEGLVGMRVGGVRQLVIPSNLAYGSSPNGNIPRYSNLVFEIELMEVKKP